MIAIYLYILLLTLQSIGANIPEQDLNLDKHKEKILVVGPLFASHPRLWYHVTKDLSKNKNYEVYQLLPIDSPYTEKVKANGVIPILNRNLTQSIIKDYEEKMKINDVQIDDMITYSVAIVKSFYSNEDLINQIKSIKFDMIVCGPFPEAELIANTLQIPLYIRLVISNPDSTMQTMLKQHASHSSQSHTSRTTLFGMEKHKGFNSLTGSFLTRLKSKLSEYLFLGIYFEIIFYKHHQVIPEHLKLEATTFRAPDLILYSGFEGLSPPLALSPNSRIIPFISEDESVHQEIPKELQEFMNRHEKLILIAFGTIQNPTNQTLREISNFMEKRTDYGFIYATRNKGYFESSIFEKIERLENVYVAKWLPQTQILNNPKVQIFFSHGGQSSYIESIEAEKPLVVIPVLAMDQYFVCEYVHAQKLGACVFKPDAYHINEMVNYVEQNNDIKNRVKILKKMIEKKRQQGLDLLYWVDYLMDIRTTEFLQANQYQYFNKFQLYDLDVNIAIALIVIAIVALFIALMKQIYNIVTCKKDKNVSKSLKID
ncbi:antennal-enriched udp-glycosyltransferase [Stylonychia lemnae]|uniref:Antennal-enriched udp-glycosyltransferase n=1 Tax=Stylonychia lemnae TaxID=5949 RepID=A0A078AQ84_STYLE|nr:antennal-enriched udp-glycosyltransferase [Stylonychia lemnae]|eukprot:CDW84131.1 antennal-enriched udp-glycosyltransferase [Stylonychia lemnae]